MSCIHFLYPRKWLLLLYCISAALLGSPSSATELTIELEPSALVVRGSEPGGSVAWLGVQRYLDPDYSVTRVTRSGVATAGADGVARIELDSPLAARALWVAVDLGSGALAATTPAGYRLARAERGHSGYSRGEDGKPDALLEDRREIAGLMVRPQVGAWTFFGADGGGSDEDGKNDGHMSLSLAHFEPLPGSPAAPAKLEDRDLWLVIDPVAMDLAIVKGGIEQ
jgi:hypothetical protein